MPQTDDLIFIICPVHVPAAALYQPGIVLNYLKTYKTHFRIVSNVDQWLSI